MDKNLKFKSLTDYWIYRNLVKSHGESFKNAVQLLRIKAKEEND